MTEKGLLEALVKEIKEMRGEMKEMKGDIKELKTGQSEIQTQQKEHTEILRAVREAQEFQKAELDRLNLTAAHIEGDVAEIKDTQKSLTDMYGSHEAAIRSLQRRPV